MHSPVTLATQFVETFDGSARADLQRFIAQHWNVTKWLVSADFALHDPSRPNDCFAFTIFPYDTWPADLEREVAAALPRDLKAAKDLDAAAVGWLRDGRAFHIAIKVDRTRAVFCNGDGSDALSVAREHIEKTLIAAPAAKADMSRFKKLKQASLAKAFNHELLGDVWLLGFFYALITCLVHRERPVDMVAWFPDRDDMTTWCEGVWYDYAYWNVHAFCDALDLDMRSTEIVVGAPDRSGAKEVMWFDHLIRGPDWFAGVVAAWDLERNLIPLDHAKYRTMVEQVMCDAANFVLVRMRFDAEGVQFSRIVSTRVKTT